MPDLFVECSSTTSVHIIKILNLQNELLIINYTTSRDDSRLIKKVLKQAGVVHRLQQNN